MKEFIIGRTYQLKGNTDCYATYNGGGYGEGKNNSGFMSDCILMGNRNGWCMLAEKKEDISPQEVIRTFATGANRDIDEGKLDYEGFLSPTVLKRYAEYMHKNRALKDGSLRDADNWQKGIPKDVYMKSMYRHFFDVWSNHRGIQTHDDKVTNLCALLFNAMGMLHEELKDNNE